MPDIDRMIDATNHNDPASTPKLSRAEQARINGARSRGPITPQGKGRACMNALKHGRYAQLADPLEIEDGQALIELSHKYRERFQPADDVEASLVDTLATIEWRLARCIAVGTRTIDIEIRRGAPASPFEAFQLTRLATAVQKLSNEGSVLESLSRQESALIRNRQTVLETLFSLRKHQPRPDRTEILNEDKLINPETIPTSNPTPGEVNPQTIPNEPEPLAA